MANNGGIIVDSEYDWPVVTTASRVAFFCIFSAICLFVAIYSCTNSGRSTAGRVIRFLFTHSNWYKEGMVRDALAEVALGVRGLFLGVMWSSVFSNLSIGLAGNRFGVASQTLGCSFGSGSDEASIAASGAALGIGFTTVCILVCLVRRSQWCQPLVTEVSAHFIGFLLLGFCSVAFKLKPEFHDVYDQPMHNISHSQWVQVMWLDRHQPLAMDVYTSYWSQDVASGVALNNSYLSTCRWENGLTTCQLPLRAAAMPFFYHKNPGLTLLWFLLYFIAIAVTLGVLRGMFQANGFIGRHIMRRAAKALALFTLGGLQEHEDGLLDSSGDHDDADPSSEPSGGAADQHKYHRHEPEDPVHSDEHAAGHVAGHGGAASAVDPHIAEAELWAEHMDEVVNDAVGNPIGFAAFMVMSFAVTYACESLSNANAPAPLTHFGFVNAAVLVVLTLSVILGTTGACNYIKERFLMCEHGACLLGCFPKGAWGLGQSANEFYMGYLLQWMLFYVTYVTHIDAEKQVELICNTGWTSYTPVTLEARTLYQVLHPSVGGSKLGTAVMYTAIGALFVCVHTLHQEHLQWQRTTLDALVTRLKAAGDLSLVLDDDTEHLLEYQKRLTTRIHAAAHAMCKCAALVIALGWEEFFDGIVSLSWHTRKDDVATGGWRQCVSAFVIAGWFTALALAWEHRKHHRHQRDCRHSGGPSGGPSHRGTGGATGDSDDEVEAMPLADAASPRDQEAAWDAGIPTSGGMPTMPGTSK